MDVACCNGPAAISTERRMADTPWDFKQALQELCEGTGRGGAACRTLFMVFIAAVTSSDLHVKLACIAGIVTLEFIRWWITNKEIPQCRLIETVSEDGSTYQKQVIHESQKPYTFTYSSPTGTITAIACVPVSAEIQSPEFEVTEGGINCKSVTIRLTPVQKGKWACDIVICTKWSKAKPDVKADSTDAAAGAKCGGDNGASSDKCKNCEEEASSKTKESEKKSSCTIS